jgi:two-component system, cell cycle sensor histidine kinase and response regulator CckA
MKKKILVVDDEEILRDMIKDYLEFKGYQIITAADQTEAMTQFNENKETVDYVILDMLLEYKPADEVFYYISKLAPNTKVILTSGFGKEDLNSKITDEAFAFIKKPFMLDELQQYFS